MKQIRFAFLPVLTSLLLGCAQQQSFSPGSTQTSRPRSAIVTNAKSSGKAFDFFLLNLSWSPEYCHSHPAATECAQHPAFVLHGLWPERQDGTYPENCSDAPGPANPGQYSDVYPDPGLLRHEWRTHGTCSGLSPDAYFTAARNAYKAMTAPPKLVQLKEQISLSPAGIAELFERSNPDVPATSLAVSCGNNYLTAVEVCLDKNLHSVSCGALRSCRANTVRIPSP